MYCAILHKICKGQAGSKSKTVFCLDILILLYKFDSIMLFAVAIFIFYFLFFELFPLISELLS